MFTPKQERQGDDLPVEIGPTRPSEDLTGEMQARMSGSENAVHVRMGETAKLMFGSNAGFPPDQINGISGPFFADLSNAPSAMWEWDSGLAIAEQPGEP